MPDISEPFKLISIYNNKMTYRVYTQMIKLKLVPALRLNNTERIQQSELSDTVQLIPLNCL
jgi:hypothetical protein